MYVMSQEAEYDRKEHTLNQLEGTQSAEDIMDPSYDVPINKEWIKN